LNCGQGATKQAFRSSTHRNPGGQASGKHGPSDLINSDKE